MRSFLLSLVLFFALSGLSFSQNSLDTKTLPNGMTIINPTMANFVKMLEMNSNDWIIQLEKIGFAEGMPYGTARSGYILYSKGKYKEGGCAALEKMGKNSLIYSWYHSANDPSTIFTGTLIELEDFFFRRVDDSVGYNFVYKGKQYKVLYISGGSQTIIGIDQF